MSKLTYLPQFLWFYIVLLVVVAGCYSQHEVEEYNQENIDSGGVKVGELPDGRKIRRYNIVWSRTGETDRVYVVDGSTTISNNFKEGKRKATNVTVLPEGEN